MRRAVAIFAVTWTLAGCAISTERQSLGYGDYAGYSCEQLDQEAQRLVRVAADRSEHLLDDDHSRRNRAMLQLSSVKRASSEKACLD